MSVKSQFSIKDLENLSGVKAHTIRIWEKRYNLLKPQRTDTNIREYDINSLKKLLNVTYLYNNGYKISKIVSLNEDEVHTIIKEQGEKNHKDYAIREFKTSMFDFDSILFLRTYEELKTKKSFREIFFEVFIPLLNEIGILWQTGSINPAHEHFISELIKQKIVLNIYEAQQKFTKKHNTLFTLFLPHYEMHEIGLMYANYEIISAGYKTIYLGSNTPLNSLKNILISNNEVIFISYLTIKPKKQSIDEYINEYQNSICSDKVCQLWLLGNKTLDINKSKINSNIQILNNLTDLENKLEIIKKA